MQASNFKCRYWQICMIILGKGKQIFILAFVFTDAFTDLHASKRVFRTRTFSKPGNG